jgi:predicted metal-dependent phosphoesterase TrpH
MIRGDFHIHSNHSFDGFMNPETILKICHKAGMNTVAITDHDTMSGYEQGRKHAHEFGIDLIPGIEISTDAGDIVALNVNEPIRSRDWESVVDAIHAQGGLAIMPHPYRSHREIEAIASKCDLIETFNGRTSEKENRLAAELAARLDKPPIAGSDAHVRRELGWVINEFDSFLSFEKTVVRPEDDKVRGIVSVAIVNVGMLVDRLRR